MMKGFKFFVYELLNFLLKFFYVLLFFVFFLIFLMLVIDVDILVTELIHIDFYTVMVSLSFSIAVILIFFLRKKMLSMKEVRKYQCVKNYNKKISKIKTSNSLKKKVVSDKAERENIKPLLKILIRELKSQRYYISQFVYDEVYSVIKKSEESNDFISIYSLYKLIISSELSELNFVLIKYCRNVENLE